MSDIEFDDLEEKESIRSYSDILKEKQNVEFETASSIEQVLKN